MAHVDSYSRIIMGTIPSEVWDEVWFSITSWKGYLQSVPGFRTLRFSARYDEQGDVPFVLEAVWDTPEALEEWHGSRFSADHLFQSFRPPVRDLRTEIYEDLT